MHFIAKNSTFCKLFLIFHEHFHVYSQPLEENGEVSPPGSLSVMQILMEYTSWRDYLTSIVEGLYLKYC